MNNIVLKSVELHKQSAISKLEQRTSHCQLITVVIQGSMVANQEQLPIKSSVMTRDDVIYTMQWRVNIPTPFFHVYLNPTISWHSREIFSSTKYIQTHNNHF